MILEIILNIINIMFNLYSIIIASKAMESIKKEREAKDKNIELIKK